MVLIAGEHRLAFGEAVVVLLVSGLGTLLLRAGRGSARRRGLLISFSAISHFDNITGHVRGKECDGVEELVSAQILFGVPMLALLLHFAKSSVAAVTSSEWP